MFIRKTHFISGLRAIRHDFRFMLCNMILIFLLAGCSSCCTNGSTQSAGGLSPVLDSNAVVIFFSATGNTKRVAECISDHLSVPIVEVVPEVAYTQADLNYNDGQSRASRENADDTSRPAIRNDIDLSSYGSIIICYPIWFGKAPKVMWTFAEGADFAGKTVIPICTSASSGAGSSAITLKNLAGAGDGRDAKRFPSNVSENDVIEYVDGIGLLTKKTNAKAIINSKSFLIELENNQTARDFIARLPLDITMTELNGNEKYCNGLPLSRDDRHFSVAEAGSLMLYSGNTIVLFYGDAGGYSYTSIGKISDISGLQEAVGSGDVRVKFELIQ